MNKVYEDILNDPLIEYLRDTCIRYAWQVPALGGRIDFVGVKASYEVIAIEAKTSNWRLAMKQAKRYQLIADKVYIALPQPVATRVSKNREKFKITGIGLISVGNSVKILIGASQLFIVQSKLRGYLLNETRRRRKKATIRVHERIHPKNPQLKKVFIPKIPEISAQSYSKVMSIDT